MATAPRTGERLVERVWERQAFDRSALRATGLSVIYRGLPSDAGGPDYQEAVLADRRGRVLSGDIEFHAVTSLWYQHGHHRDRRYNGVILHVVWIDDVGVTEREDGAVVPVVALADHVRDDAISSHEAGSEALLPHPCIRSFSSLTTAELRDRLRHLGVGRFDEQTARFQGDLEAESPDQVLYTGLLEALGYASNRDVFRRLADVAPYAWIASLPAPRRRAALLDAAGLGPPCGLAIPVRIPQESWRLARIRPANHPATRVEGIAALLSKLGPSPSGMLAQRVRSAISPLGLRRALMVEGGAIGAGRADEIAISVVLPFVHAVDSAADASKLYARYPSAPVNRWTRLMQGMFKEAGHDIRPSNAPEHQGIHQLYHRHCRYERVSGCAVCGDAPSGGNR